MAHKQKDADLEGLMKKMELENLEVAADDDSRASVLVCLPVIL